MSRVAIVGAGNLGSFLAANLRLAGHQSFLCTRRSVPAIRVDGLPEIQIPVYIDNPPQADIVLLTVKAYDTISALGWLRKLCGDGQSVAVIQNGVHHAARIAPFAAIPVLSYVYVEGSNGTYRAFEPPRAHFTVPDDPMASPFAALFANTPIRVHRESAFHAATWRKMLHNCVSNPLTALAGRGLEILREPLYRGWAERILAEALPIANADSADLTNDETQSILDVLASYPPGTRTSMLQDREQGKRLELDVLNGALIELGRRFGLPTPVNQDLVTRLAV
jgi:2-dehydropantoate 2-reductase